MVGDEVKSTVKIEVSIGSPLSIDNSHETLPHPDKPVDAGVYVKVLVGSLTKYYSFLKMEGTSRFAAVQSTTSS